MANSYFQSLDVNHLNATALKEIEFLQKDAYWKEVAKMES